MTVVVIYAPEALSQLKRIDNIVSKRIVLKIADNASQRDPLARAKSLQGGLSGKYRYRIGDYRAIFKMDDSGNMVLLTILNIKHRKDVYR